MALNKNRMANVNNVYQNISKYKRVLCVCSAGLLRSPTMAYVLANEPFNHNTRAAGVTSEYALIPVDDALVAWAEEIVCADTFTMIAMRDRYPDREIRNLGISDDYNYRDPELIELITKRYME